MNGRSSQELKLRQRYCLISVLTGEGREEPLYAKALALITETSLIKQLFISALTPCVPEGTWGRGWTGPGSLPAFKPQTIAVGQLILQAARPCACDCTPEQLGVSGAVRLPASAPIMGPALEELAFIAPKS